MIRPAVFYTLAAAVPAVALWFAAPPERAAHGLAVCPFGWPSLLVVQCLAAVPLAAVVATRVKLRTPIPALVAGVLLAVSGFFSVGTVGDALSDAGFAVRCLVRSLGCVLLAVPWAVAARAGSGTAPASWPAVAVGLVVGFVLPGVWAEKLAGETVQRFSGEVLQGRLVRAGRSLDAAIDLAPDRVVSGGTTSRSVAELRKGLTADVARVTGRVARPPAESARWEDRVGYAADLIALDRLTEAEAVLAMLNTNPAAQRRLSEVYQLQGRYTESDAVLRAFLAEGLPRADKPAVRAACAEAFAGLANNAAERRDYAAVEAALREGLEKLPAEEARFRFELGKHFHMRNRPLDAVRELNTAVRLDESLAPSAEPILRNIREHTPACFVGW